jgi:hypothetical protein
MTHKLIHPFASLFLALVVSFAAAYPASAAPNSLFAAVDFDNTEEVNVEIDIKPGHFPNRIKLTQNVCNDDDNLSVAILTTPKFNARTVDVATIQFGDPNLGGKVSPVKSRLTNVDGDLDKDLALTFTLCSIVASGAIDGNSTELVLTGRTLSGVNITGRDSVKVAGTYYPVKPVFDYPVDGQTLDYEGSYLFRVRPIPSAKGFL